MAVEMKKMYETKLFCEIYESADDFVEDYLDFGLGGLTVDTTEEDYGLVPTLYYLMFARHGNDPIANYDENQFKTKLWTMVWQYGFVWEKKIDIQNNLRALNLAELREGAESIANHASNPNTSPNTNAYDALPYIDSQNAIKGKLSPIDAYAKIWNMLDADATDEFLQNFDKLFKKFVKPGTYLYVEDIDDEA